MLRDLEEREAGGRTLPNRAPTAHPTPTAATTAATTAAPTTTTTATPTATPTPSPTSADEPGPEVAEHPRIREARLLRALEEKARREAPRPMAEPDAVLVMGGPEGEESAANAPPTWPRYAEAEPPPSPGPLARTLPRPRARPHRASAPPPPAEQVDVPARLDTWGE
jgi:hypothetical protein